jgi:hypothetical protein
METHSGTAVNVRRALHKVVQRAAYWKVSATGERLGHGIIGHRASWELAVVGCTRGWRYSRPR